MRFFGGLPSEHGWLLQQPMHEGVMYSHPTHSLSVRHSEEVALKLAGSRSIYGQPSPPSHGSNVQNPKSPLQEQARPSLGQGEE